MRYIFDDYILDTQRYELHCAGTRVHLRPKGFQVLAYLLAHRDRVVPKSELLEHVWPQQFIGDATLNSCIMAVRKALRDSGRTPRFLHTVHGQGYRFVAPVEVREHLPEDAAPHALPLHAGEGGTHQGTGPSPLLTPPCAGTGSTPLESLDGEHKQVTVLCGALAEALVLVARLGPEAMHYLMRDVLALAQDTVQRYDGTIIHVSGEGFLALFGAPVAQEDHARRAVLAALDLRQRLHSPAALRGQLPDVALRLGLHTGPVVVGPLASEPQRPYTAAGDTLHLALWLQQRAAPDTILVSAATYALVQDEVQGEVCDTSALEALCPPGPVYAIHGLTRRRAGVPRRGARPLSRFVGRPQELALLQGRLAHAVGGQGQVIGIAGEPGLGKSRLLAEFAHSLDAQAVMYCEGHCLAYGSTTPYLPVRDLLRQLWDLPNSAPTPAITATIQQRLHEAGVTSEAEMLLLLQLLNIPVDLAPLDALSPQERKTRTFALLRYLIRHASQGQPLVLAVENLHWSDPTSDEWLASLVAQLADTAVLLLATYRPGYQPPWIRHSAATQMALPRLSPGDSLAVLRSVPQAAQLPVAMQETIVAKAAGNPFFVEELTWAAVGYGDQAGTLPLPDTIEAVLAARIDRLPLEEKRLVQIAAVIGTEVSVPLVHRLAGLPEDTLQRSLAHLQETELLYETRLFPDQVYTFKHALTHEVAYGGLLQERRRALHAQIVEALETLYAEQRGEHIERLAYHAFQGEVWEQALAYCRQASAKASARSASREAVAHLEQALAVLQHLPESRDTRAQAIDLRLELRNALHPLGEHGRIHDFLHEADCMAEALGDPRRLSQVSALLGHYFGWIGEQEHAIERLQHALAIARDLGDVVLQLTPNFVLGEVHFSLGNYRQATQFLRQVMASLTGDLAYERFGWTMVPSVCSRQWLVYCLAELGEFVEGTTLADEGVRIAEAVNHPFTLEQMYDSVGSLYLRKGDFDCAISVLERALGLCRAANIQSSVPGIASALGHAYALAGRVDEALPLLEQAVERATAMKRGIDLTRCVASLSEGYLLASRRDAAVPLAQRALKLSHEHKERGGQAWALRLLGEIAARCDPPKIESAEASYRQALALADELGMRPLVAHCQRGLGTLYAKIDRREQARAALTTAIALYRAMDMTFWLPQAEATLAQVA